jgi:protein-S-isoprenylcysteine O-methyltransferase Ste14
VSATELALGGLITWQEAMKPPRIMPPVYLLLAIVAMVAIHFLLPGVHLVFGYWRWAGAALILAGVGLVVRVAKVFNRHKTTIKPGEVSSHLVTDGPFRVSRNPIYLGMVLILMGMAVALGSLTPWFVVPAFVAIITRNVIPVEEAMLKDAFGETYAQYRARVRRWI